MIERRIDFNSAIELYQKERCGGVVIKSPRKFGVEFEIVPDFNKIKDGDHLSTVHKKTGELLPKAWGSGRDGSITEGGIEIQSAPMVMKIGEDSIVKFCDGVKKLGWKTDDSCGIHVHIDANDIRLKPEYVRRLFLAYFVMDYTLLAMVPESRRTNVYCAPMDATKSGKLLRHRGTQYRKGWEMKDIVTTKGTRVDFLEMFYKKPYDFIPNEIREHYCEARYHGINFHPLYGDYGTVEVRYLEGTLDSNTILNWIAFHQHFVDNARMIREVEALELFHLKGPKTRLRKFAELTSMPKNLVDWACGRIDVFK